MFRATIHYLLIAVVLGCPYCCLVESVAQSGSRALGCQCFCLDCGILAVDDAVTFSQVGSPAQNKDRKPCDSDSDCLCHGATLIARDVESQQFRVTSSESSGSVIQTVRILAPHSAGSSLVSRHFPQQRTGREICALTCALLL